MFKNYYPKTFTHIFFFFTPRISKSNKSGRCEDWLSDVKPRPEQIGEEHLTLFPKVG